MNLDLLKDNVYLTLLAFYDNVKMPSFVSLSQKTGLTRQTVSKKVKNLLDTELIIIDENDIVHVSNKLDINVNKLNYILTLYPGINVLTLKEKLFGPVDNISEAAKELGLSRTSIYHCKNSKMVVYGIISEGIVKYIGSTKCYEERIKQHILNRPFLTNSNFIILKEIDENDRFFQERQLIEIIQPEWNIMGKEF